MVYDTLENLDKYASLHKNFRKVFDFIKGLDFSALKVGRIESEDGSFYINVDESELRLLPNALLETHDRYIDIQIPLTRSEVIACKCRSECVKLSKAEPQKDIAFYEDLPLTFVNLEVGQFIILFPQDAHAPLIGKEGSVKKMVVKVLMD